MVSVAVVLLHCGLPKHGDDDWRETGGDEEGAWLQLLVPADARRPGAFLPVAVEVQLPGAKVLNKACVALTSRPGKVEVPFGKCAGTEPSSEGTGGVGGNENGAAGAPADGEGHAQGCLEVTKVGAVYVGSTLGLYTPSGSEATITLLGALYANETCSGTPAATVARTIDVSPPETEDAGGAGGVGGSSVGGQGGVAGTSGEAGAGGEAGASGAGGAAGSGGAAGAGGVPEPSGGQGGAAPSSQGGAP